MEWNTLEKKLIESETQFLKRLEKKKDIPGSVSNPIVVEDEFPRKITRIGSPKDASEMTCCADDDILLGSLVSECTFKESAPID